MTVFTNITIPLLVEHIFCLGSLDSIFSFFISIIFYLYTFLSLLLFFHFEKVRSNHFLVLVTSRLLCEYLKHPPICIMVFRRNPFSNHTPTVSFSDSRSFFCFKSLFMISNLLIRNSSVIDLFILHD